MRFTSPFRMTSVLTASLICALAPATAFCAPNSKAMREALIADYSLTKVGMTGLADNDDTRITQPGAILAVRLPGIYADMANTQNVIVNTNVANGQVSQATGFTAAFGGSTAHSRTLAPNEKAYVTQITVKRDAVLMELVTVDVTTLADGQGTRYRAEVNVKLPGLDSMTPEDVKKTIETVIADPATASAFESKTIKLGMSPDEVKKSLGNPDEIVDLGAKQIYVYKDIKWCSSTARFQTFSDDRGPAESRMLCQALLCSTPFHSRLLPGVGDDSAESKRWAMTEAPISRVSAVVSMLGDLSAFCASFLILGEVIAAGAVGIAPFYLLAENLHRGHREKRCSCLKVSKACSATQS